MVVPLLKTWAFIGVPGLCVANVLAFSDLPKGQTVPAFREEVGVLAVSFWVRADGDTLAPGDLKVEVDGQPVRVLAVEPMAPSPLSGETWANRRPAAPGAGPQAVGVPVPEVLVVIPAHNCSRFCLSAGAEFLAKNAERLVALGPVRVMLARHRAPEELLGPSVVASAVREFAEHEMMRVVSRNDLVDEQRWFSHRAWEWGRRATARTTVPSPLVPFLHAGVVLREVLQHVRLAVGTLSPSRPRAVFLLSDGVVAKSYSVWEKFAAPDEERKYRWESTAQQWGRWEFERQAASLLTWFARDLAADGIILFPVFPGFAGSFRPGWAASNSGGGAFREFMSVGYTQGNLNPGLAIDDPVAGLAELAGASGGKVVAGDSEIVPDFFRLYLVTYQVPLGTDVALHRLHVERVGGKGELWAPGFVRHGRSGAEAEAQARRLLAGEQHAGELRLQVGLAGLTPVKGNRWQSKLVATTDFQSWAPVLSRLGRARLRVTVAVHLKKGEPFVHQEEFQQVLNQQSEGTVWTYEAPIRLPKEAERLAVVVEELQTGAWGAAVVDLKGEGKP